jgi:hypothetical protein
MSRCLEASRNNYKARNSEPGLESTDRLYPYVWRTGAVGLHYPLFFEDLNTVSNMQCRKKEKKKEEKNDMNVEREVDLRKRLCQTFTD